MKLRSGKKLEIISNTAERRKCQKANSSAPASKQDEPVKDSDQSSEAKPPQKEEVTPPRRSSARSIQHKVSKHTELLCPFDEPPVVAVVSPVVESRSPSSPPSGPPPMLGFGALTTAPLESLGRPLAKDWTYDKPIKLTEEKAEAAFQWALYENPPEFVAWAKTVQIVEYTFDPEEYDTTVQPQRQSARKKKQVSRLSFDSFEDSKKKQDPARKSRRRASLCDLALATCPATCFEI